MHRSAHLTEKSARTIARAWRWPTTPLVAELFRDGGALRLPFACAYQFAGSLTTVGLARRESALHVAPDASAILPLPKPGVNARCARPLRPHHVLAPSFLRGDDCEDPVRLQDYARNEKLAGPSRRRRLLELLLLLDA